MALVLTADANPGTSAWVDESTLAGGLSTVQTRIQLADLGSGTSTGTVLFGDTIAANRVIIGSFFHLNANPVAGGTVAEINVTLSETLEAIGEWLLREAGPEDVCAGDAERLTTFAGFIRDYLLKVDKGDR